MEKEQLNKYFPVAVEDADTFSAYGDLRKSCREFAETINSRVPESPSKGDILGRLFRIEADAELAIRMDGVNRTLSPIVTIKH